MGSESLQAYSWICYSFGGIVFGVLGGFMLDNLSPSFVFYVTAFLGLLITINAFMTSPKLEEGAKHIIKLSLWERTKLNFREIWSGFKIRPLFRLALFNLIFCGIVPKYISYFYYYLTEELLFSQMQYSMLAVVAYVALLFVLYLYNLWFKESESRTMLIISCFLSAYGSLNAALLIRGFTYGMDPTTFVFFSTTLTDTLLSAIHLMSGNVLFAKLIPANIEASMFSILTGIANFCNFFVAAHLGNFFNLFVGVTEENLEYLWVLELIAAGAALVPLFFVWLVPLRQEVFKVLQVNKFFEKYQRSPGGKLTDESDDADADDRVE